MKDYVEISFSPGTATNEMLLAALAGAGFEGFEEREDCLHAFILEEEFDETLARRIADSFQEDFTLRIIQPINWNEAWEAGFEPVLVGEFAAIRAHFHPEVPGVRHEIIITPKMSFGTGHHATTYLMIDAISGIDFNGKAALDFGTGTGILAILAEKCGASRVVAIDNDEWSISNARENIATNGCNRIELLMGDTARVHGTFDIILANINRNVILDNLDVLVSQLASGGTLLLSGLLVEDEHAIDQACRALYLKLVERSERSNWLCLRYYH